MASTILGPQFDIHTGGTDLKFPHHDNEISQSAAHYDSDNWVNFFLHSGHLNISGCKMSKSLKNLITIKEALEKYTPRQIRLLFLLHSWSSTLDYSDHGMETALNYEKNLNEFFLNVKTHSRSIKQLNHSDAYTKFTEHDLSLNERFSKIKQHIHLALCDSIDTPTVMKHIRDLITATNTYMNTKNAIINCLLLRNIAIYITRLLDIFGLNSSSSSIDNNIGFTRLNEQQIGTVNIENIAMPYMEAFASFRDDVRKQAIAIRNKEILTLSDRVRDETFPGLGFRLEDQGGTNKAIIKYCGMDVSRQEREQASVVKNGHQKDEKQMLEQQSMKETKASKNELSKENKDPEATDPSKELLQQLSMLTVHNDQ